MANTCSIATVQEEFASVALFKDDNEPLITLAKTVAKETIEIYGKAPAITRDILFGIQQSGIPGADDPGFINELREFLTAEVVDFDTTVAMADGHRKKSTALEDPLVNYFDSVSGNTDSEIIDPNTAVKDIAQAELTGKFNDDLRKVQSRFFQEKTAFIDEFHGRINSYGVSMMMGLSLKPGQKIQDVDGPTSNLSKRYKELQAKLKKEAEYIQNKTKSEVDAGFASGDNKIKNSYYAHVALSNIELFLNVIAPGSSFNTQTDARGTKPEFREFGYVKGYAVKVIYKDGLEKYVNAGDNELDFDIIASTDAEKVQFVKDMLEKDAGDSEMLKFVAFKNVPKGYSIARFNSDFPGLQADASQDDIDKLGDGDVFVMKNGHLTRASGSYKLSYNMSDNHKTGHEDDFNGFDNDTQFIKFMVKSTPRLLYSGEGMVQDNSHPFLRDGEFYTIVGEISKIKDRSFEGISNYLRSKLSDSNSAIDVLYRSLYYTYFAGKKDKVFEYTPVGEVVTVRTASLGAVASLKKFQFKDKHGAPDMMSALIQFMSKQSVGRISFEDGKLSEYESAEVKPFMITLPDSIESAMFETEGTLKKDASVTITSVETTGKLDNVIEIKYKSPKTNIPLHVTVTSNMKGNLNIKLTNKNEFSVDEIREIFESLGLPPKLYQNRKMVDMLRTRAKEALPNFIGSTIAMAALKDKELSKPITRVINEDGTVEGGKDAPSAAADAIRLIGISNSPHSYLAKSLKYIVDIYDEVHGTGSPSFDMTGDGNRAARYTNIDREGRLVHIIDTAKDRYSKFGLAEPTYNPDNIFDYVTTTGTPGAIITTDHTRELKDGIKENDQFYSNNDMTVKMRVKHMVEGAFFSKMANKHESGTFLVQPMTYSDRSAIYMYKYALGQDVDLATITAESFKTNNYLGSEDLDAIGKLKKNYVDTYRKKYDSMQFNVVRSWTEFLLGPDILKWGGGEIDIAAARRLGYELASMSREDMNGTNVFKKLSPQIAALGIDPSIALKSSQLSKGLSMSIQGGVAVPTPNSGLMTEYLANNQNAYKFVKNNISNTLNTFQHEDIGFDKLSEQAQKDVATVFGRTDVTFDEAMEVYHLMTAPINDQLIDTLMSPDTEFGNNKTSVELNAAGGSISSENMPAIMEERSVNFIKQSKRVQSMGSKGIRPRIFKSAGHYRKALPTTDLYFGISKDQKDIIANAATPKEMFSGMISSGVFTKYGDHNTVEHKGQKYPAITIAGFMAPLVVGPDGLFTYAQNSVKSSMVYMQNQEKFDEVLAEINTAVSEAYAGLGIQESFTSLTYLDTNFIKAKDLPAGFVQEFQKGNVFSEIVYKLQNDEGEAGFGLEDTSKNVLIDEDSTVGPAHILGALGLATSQDSLDGVQWAHPLHFLKLNGSLGNEFSSFSTDGSGIKDLTQYVDPRTGRLVLQKKSTQNIFSNEILKNMANPALHKTFKNMNTAVKFDSGISVMIPDVGTDGMPDGAFSPKRFANVDAFLDFLTKRGEVDPEGFARSVVSNFDALRGVQPTGMLVEVPLLDKNYKPIEGKTEFKEFQDLDQLWSYFGKWKNDNAWELVGQVLSNAPSIRNAYVEKIGFTSNQKTGASALNDGKVLKDPSTKASDMAMEDIPNETHIVMLQKNHDFETSDAAAHQSKLAVPSQFLSALLFEGKTMLEAMNSMKGIAMLTDIRINKFYMGIGKAIYNDTDDYFKSMEGDISYSRNGKIIKAKFSEIPLSHVGTDTISAFDEMMENHMEFKKELYRKMAVEKMSNSINEDRDSVVMIALLDDPDLADSVSFNSLLLREKAVNTMRSSIHADNIKTTLPGFIAVTSPSDFVTSLYNTSEGRKPRMDAVDQILNDPEGKRGSLGAAEFQALLDTGVSVLETDMVRVHTDGAKPKLMYAVDVATAGKVMKVEYAMLNTRNKEIDLSEEEGVPNKNISLSNKSFANSLFRGQEHKPSIDKDGNMVLQPNYDSLFKSYGVSFAENAEMADEYGLRQSVNPYTIEIDADFLDTIIPLNTEGGTQDYGSRVVGDEGEQRLITKDKIVIPKGKFAVRRGDIEIENIKEINGETLIKYINDLEVEGDLSEAARYDETGGYQVTDQKMVKDITQELASRGLQEEEHPYVLWNPVYEKEYYIVKAYEYENNIKIDKSEITPEIEEAYDAKRDMLLDKINNTGDPHVREIDIRKVMRMLVNPIVENNPPTKVTNRDWVVNKNNPQEILPPFYAKAKYGTLRDFELYTDTDGDLKWYQYTANIKGQQIVVEDTKEFQDNYLINKDSALFFSLPGNDTYAESFPKAGLKLKAKPITDKDVEYNDEIKRQLKEVKKFIRGKLMLFMENNEIEVTLPEAYSSNFNMIAFDMTPDDQVSTVIGHSQDPTSQYNSAQAFFKSRMWDKDHRHKYVIPYIKDVNENNINKLKLKYGKLIVKETDGGKNRIYRNILNVINKSLETDTEVDFGKVKKTINEVIRKGNTVQISIAASKRAKSFINSLEVMPPRIPGQGKQSGALMRIVAFINSNKNAFYAPREYYLNSGQDNDIDTNNVITRAIDEKGFQYEYNNLLIYPADHVTKTYEYEKDEFGNVTIDPTTGKKTIETDSHGNQIYKETLKAEHAGKHYPIMNPDGSNPNVVRAIARVENTMNKAIQKSIEAGNEVTALQARNIINARVRDELQKIEKGIQNYVIDNMREIMRNPVNAVELETPITMDDLNDIIDSANSKKRISGYDYSKQGINSFNSAWIPVLEKLNMDGKMGIAHYANGQRTLAGISAVQYEVGRDLKIGTNSPAMFGTTKSEKRVRAIKNSYKHLKHIQYDPEVGYIKDDETAGFVISLPRKDGDKGDGKEEIMRDSYADIDFDKNTKSGILEELTDEQNLEVMKLTAELDRTNWLGNTKAWEQLSQLLSAATDNAKALILGKMGANTDNNGLIASMLIMGFSIDHVHRFLNQPDIKALFKQFNADRDGFNFAYLKSYLENLESPGIAVQELLELVIITDQMAEFRRVLTISQNNRIETRDLYKAMSPIYTSGKDISIVDLMDGTSEYAQNEHMIGSKDKKKKEDKDKTPTFFNSLFFISKHAQGRSIINATSKAESVITAISDVDRLLALRIKKIAHEEGKILSVKTYENVMNFINDVLVDKHMQGKKMVLPTIDGMRSWDLGNADSRADAVYDTYKSVEYMRTKLSLMGVSNEFLNAIEFRKSKEIDGKMLIAIPYLAEAEVGERSKYELAISELKNMNKTHPDDTETYNEVMFLLDSLFKYSIITGKGADSRNSIVSIFPDEFVQFSKDLGNIDLENETSISDYLLNNHDILMKLIDDSAHKTENLKEKKNEGPNSVVDNDGQWVDLEDTGKASRGKGKDLALMRPLPLTKMYKKLKEGRRKSGLIVKYNHPKLNKNLYLDIDIPKSKVMDPSDKGSQRIVVKLFRRNSRETIAINQKFSVDNFSIPGISRHQNTDIGLAGWMVGLPAILNSSDAEVSNEGRVLAYLSSGRYLISDANNELQIMSDVTLELLNPGMVFYGHDFRKANNFELSLKKRSFRHGSYIRPGKVNKHVNVVGKQIVATMKNSMTEYKVLPKNVKRIIIDYIYTSNSNSVVVEAKAFINEALGSIQNVDVVGSGNPFTLFDIQLFMKTFLADGNILDRNYKSDKSVTVDPSWFNPNANLNNNDIKNVPTFTIDEFVHEYIEVRQGGKVHVDGDIEAVKVNLFNHILNNPIAGITKMNVKSKTLEKLTTNLSGLIKSKFIMDEDLLKHAESRVEESCKG